MSLANNEFDLGTKSVSILTMISFAVVEHQNLQRGRCMSNIAMIHDDDEKRALFSKESAADGDFNGGERVPN